MRVLQCICVIHLLGHRKGNCLCFVNLFAETLLAQTCIMINSTCEVLIHHYAMTTEVEILRFTYISNCVLNSLLSHLAIMLNIVTIYAIRKTLSLPKTLKTLLLSLAVSDVGVGLLVQPFYTSLLVSPCNKIFPAVTRITCLSSYWVCFLQLRSWVLWL